LFRFESPETNVSDSAFIFRLRLPEAPNARKSLEVLRFVAVVSPACIRPCVRSSRLLRADCAASGRLAPPVRDRPLSLDLAVPNINIAVCSSDNAVKWFFGEQSLGSRVSISVLFGRKLSDCKAWKVQAGHLKPT
jgi:hypothetical protein